MDEIAKVPSARVSAPALQADSRQSLAQVGGPGAGRSAAYAVSEMFGWAGTLDARPKDARAFYATIAVATLLGAALSLVGLDPVRALYWAAVVNGVLAAPLMAVMMLIVRNPRVMGRLTLSRSMAIWGWAATAVMAAASLAFFILP